MVQKLLLFIISLAIFPMGASAYQCGANGMVSEATYTYNYIGGHFIKSPYRYWYRDYYARIIKSVVGTVYAGDHPVRDIKFLLVSASDANGCDVEIDWVADEDFIHLP